MKSKREVEELFEKSNYDKSQNALSQNRPRVRGIVAWLIILGIVITIQGFTNVNRINTFKNDMRYIIPEKLVIASYTLILSGIIGLMAAVLISRYKRIGLIMGGVVYIISLLATVAIVSRSEDSIFIMLQLSALYYIYKYLTQQPEASFFT